LPDAAELVTAELDATELEAAELAALVAAADEDSAEEAALLAALEVSALLDAADVVLPEALPLFELHAASAAPAAITEPIWKKRRRLNRDMAWDSSGSVIDGPFLLRRSIQSAGRRPRRPAAQA